MLAIAALAAGPSVANAAATGVAAGSQQTCALILGGGMRCWGSNFRGEIGDGTTTHRPIGADVSGLTTGVAAMAAGYLCTCALTTGGGAKCWGSNFHGQLGDGTTTDRLTPVDVSGLTSGVAAIAAGGYFYTCALTTDGGVKCWGRNDFGQLGDGTTTDRLTPVAVSGLTSGVAAIAAGGSHACALTVGGGVKCWGHNFGGQLGDGTTTDRLTPVDVGGLTSGVAAIATGQSHTCALTVGGGVECWGSNFNGQLGDGTTTGRLTPVDVSGLTSGVAAVDAGYAHTCALTTGGGVKCWGENVNGQLGVGGETPRPDRVTPIDVSGLTSGVAGIATGQFHTCALTTGGGVKCWGLHAVGDGTMAGRSTAVDVVGLPSASAVIGTAGGTLTTPDGRVTLEIPPGAISESTAFHLTEGSAKSEFGAGSTTKNLASRVEVAPKGITFAVPGTLTVTWPDTSPDDGKVDGTTIREKTLHVYRNGVAVPGTTRCDEQVCTLAACCDMAGNTWKVQAAELGEWAVGTACVEARYSKLALTTRGRPGADDTLRFSGIFALPGPGAVADQLDVVHQGIVVQLVDGGALVRQTPEGDAVVLEVEIPGGAYDALTKVGWKASNGKRWVWVGPKVGSPGGIRTVTLREVGARAGAVRFAVKGSAETYDAKEWQGEHLNPVLTLPESGQCYEAVFPGDPGPRCRVNETSTSVTRFKCS